MYTANREKDPDTLAGIMAVPYEGSSGWYGQNAIIGWNGKNLYVSTSCAEEKIPAAVSFVDYLILMTATVPTTPAFRASTGITAMTVCRLCWMPLYEAKAAEEIRWAPPASTPSTATSSVLLPLVWRRMDTTMTWACTTWARA